MDDVKLFLDYLETMKGPCTDFCLKCPAQGDLKQFYEIVNKLYHKNQILTAENSRLTDLCQNMLDKMKICYDALKGTADQTYIFRRSEDDN